MSKGEILYIEDNFHNRRIVRKILERQDYVLYDAEDGLEGYQRLQELMPKVVLLDISLPSMDGIEIANKVKADEKTRDVILIALTASAMSGDRERFLEAGCDDYLSKPFRALDLVEMVDFYMSPDFVPGTSLSPGAKLMLSKEDASKPIVNGNTLPKPDLSRKTKPKSEVVPDPEPKSEVVPDPEPKPATKETAETAKSNGTAKSQNNHNHTPKKSQPRRESVERGKTDTNRLSSEISNIFKSLNPADPNKDED